MVKFYLRNRSWKRLTVCKCEMDPYCLRIDKGALRAEAILLESKELGQKIFGLAVCANHVHLAISNISLPIGRVVSHYKHAIRLALQNEGFVGRLWTAGFDKRYCMNERELAEKIRYIQHQQW